MPSRKPLSWVPTADLMAVLRERYLDKPDRSVHTLAQTAGISAKTIESWQRGETARVRFTAADRVLTSAGLTDAWFTSPALRGFYNSEEAA